MTKHWQFSAIKPSQPVATRHKLFEPVVMHHDGARLRAHLLDLSATGALVHADRPPMMSERIYIETTDMSVAGHVMWVRAKRFGLHFDVRLTDAIVQRIIESR